MVFMPLQIAREQLKQILLNIEKNNTNYDKRYNLVVNAMSKAIECGFKAGVRVDPQEPEWPVFYIELPTGQVSWHMPQHEKQWDGHTTEEKYERIKQFNSKLKGVPGVRG